MKKILLIFGTFCVLFSTTLFGANSVLKDLDLDLRSLYNAGANSLDQNASKLDINSTRASRAADITAATKTGQNKAEQNASQEQNATAQITPDERMRSKIRMLIMSDFDKNSKARIVLINDTNASASAKAQGYKVVAQSAPNDADIVSIPAKSWTDLVVVNAGLDTAFAARSLRQNQAAGLATAFKLDFGGDTKKFRKLLDTYRGAVAARSVRIFMLGSGEVRSMDESAPASLSSHAIGGLIRSKLHFGGLIISADLSKISGYSTEQKVSSFLGAGGDIMYFSDSAEAARAADFILKSTQNGSISNARINKSFERVSEVFNIEENKAEPALPF